MGVIEPKMIGNWEKGNQQVVFSAQRLVPRRAGMRLPDLFLFLKGRNSMEKKYWWLSIEGCGASILGIPLTRDEVLAQWLNVAWADQIIGFPTSEEQQRMQAICLTAPLPSVKEAMAKLAERVQSGEIAV